MKPRITVDFLDALKARHNLPSDYALGKFLGMHRQVISHYRRGKGTFDEEISIRVAELLEIPAGYVLACIEEERAERTKRPQVQAAWHKVAQALAPVFAVGIIGGSALLAPSPSQASYGQEYTLYE